ncbi:uncharacterized protein LOC101858965 isoform X1 [Aplysia californica]|uniref:Uncharacterized protein LOC101858965 isoform X1 n=1 Tax=Aplysia californica TaxID=6500 RepID=A0ABM1A896_APLCA|nr:uncharacterized protein LOC101858965 isoform X1 [Aplysia californica]
MGGPPRKEHSLHVLSNKYIIQAHRVSKGGSLILVPAARDEPPSVDVTALDDMREDAMLEDCLKIHHLPEDVQQEQDFIAQKPPHPHSIKAPPTEGCPPPQDNQSESSVRKEGRGKPPEYTLCADMIQDLILHGPEFLDNAHGQALVHNCPVKPDLFPAHTLHIRWRQGHKLPSYTPQAVHAILQRYGQVTFLCQLSHNSVLAVFDSLGTARRLMQCGRVGHGCSPLVCDWWCLDMNRYARQEEEAEARANEHPIRVVRHSAGTLYNIHWRRMVEKVRHSCRMQDPFFTYRRRDFIP